MVRAPARSIPAWLEHFLVIALYTVFALALSYPLALEFADHIPGVDGDVWSYLWAMGWARAAVLDLGVNPFHSDYVFYPLGGATQLLWGTALPSFASIPLQLAFGLVPAFNLTYLAASVLTGYGMYLLAGDVLKLRATERSVQAAAFLSGVIFAFGALRLGYGLAFTNLFHTEFIPFYLLFLRRATRSQARKDAMRAGLFFALNVYIDFQIAAFLAVLTALWVGYILVGHAAAGGTANAMTSPLRQWALLVVVAGLLSLPMLGAVLADFAVEGGNYIRVYPLRYSAERSYDLLAYVVPNARSSLYARLEPLRVEGVNVSVSTTDESELSPDRQVFLGFGVLALVLLGALSATRRMGFWILVTIVFALLSFGPVLHAGGVNTGVPLPFALVNAIPVLNHIRIPMRYGLMVFLGAALLAGAGAQVLIARRWWWAVVIAALVLLESAVLPYPTLEFRAPNIYQAIAQEPGDFTVLEVPSFNWRYAAKNEAYQAVHHKRILRAYTNRIAPDVADYFNLRQTPVVVRSLRILEGAEQGVLTEQELAQDRAAARATVSFFDIRYVIVHHDQLEPERAQQIEKYLREVLEARVVDEQGDVTAYRLPVPPELSPALELDLADNSSLMYLGRGWQMEPLAQEGGTLGRYVKDGHAEVYLPLSSTAVRELAWQGMGAPPGARVELNGSDLGTIRQSSDDWSWYPVLLQPQFLRSGMNRLVLRFAAPGQTVAVGAFKLNPWGKSSE